MLRLVQLKTLRRSFMKNRILRLYSRTLLVHPVRVELRELMGQILVHLVPRGVLEVMERVEAVVRMAHLVRQAVQEVLDLPVHMAHLDHRDLQPPPAHRDHQQRQELLVHQVHQVRPVQQVLMGHQARLVVVEVLEPYQEHLGQAEPLALPVHTEHRAAAGLLVALVLMALRVRAEHLVLPGLMAQAAHQGHPGHRVQPPAPLVLPAPRERMAVTAPPGPPEHQEHRPQRVPRVLQPHPVLRGHQVQVVRRDQAEQVGLLAHTELLVQAVRREPPVRPEHHPHQALLVRRVRRGQVGPQVRAVQLVQREHMELLGRAVPQVLPALQLRVSQVVQVAFPGRLGHRVQAALQQQAGVRQPAERLVLQDQADLQVQVLHRVLLAHREHRLPFREHQEQVVVLVRHRQVAQAGRVVLLALQRHRLVRAGRLVRRVVVARQELQALMRLFQVRAERQEPLDHLLLVELLGPVALLEHQQPSPDHPAPLVHQERRVLPRSFPVHPALPGLLGHRQHSLVHLEPPAVQVTLAPVERREHWELLRHFREVAVHPGLQAPAGLRVLRAPLIRLREQVAHLGQQVFQVPAARPAHLEPQVPQLPVVLRLLQEPQGPQGHLARPAHLGPVRHRVLRVLHQLPVRPAPAEHRVQREVMGHPGHLEVQGLMERQARLVLLEAQVHMAQAVPLAHTGPRERQGQAVHLERADHRDRQAIPDCLTLILLAIWSL